MRSSRSVLLVVAASWIAIPAFAAEPNRLSPFEERGGWKLLFDGQSTQGWHNYQKSDVNSGWVVEDGALIRKEKGAGDLISDEEYGSYDLQLEYRISPAGNSGLMFMVQESEQRPYHTGPEIQIQDNAAGKDPQKAGWLYQLYPSPTKDGKHVDATRPAGEWNSLVLSVTPKQCEIYMNGVPYSKFQVGSKDWDKRVAASKFKDWPFAKKFEGRLCLQDHGDVVAFRNIKIRPREANGSVKDPSDGNLKLKPVLAFPDLKWDGWQPENDNGVQQAFRTIFLEAPDDGTNRLFAGDQWGVLYAFENRPNVKASKRILDLTSKIQYGDRQNEQGLLGLAIHPKFKDNGYIYLYYTLKPGLISIISRFTFKGDVVDPDSELELMRVDQPFWNHNGGTLDFGPDGMLYAVFGDGGSAGDPELSGQDLKSLLGKVIRIDVDHPADGKNYGVPKDNPFVNRPDARPEIFAYGLRNPWRMAFDRKTGDLWAGEVGQNMWEEIFIIKKGGNYGWSVVEGLHPYGEPRPSGADPFVDPIWEYDHYVGKSITGGSVYRGQKLPDLQGKYVYADYISGQIWALLYDSATGKVVSNETIPSDRVPILSFGEDSQGEIYFCTVAANGKGIYKFVKQP